MEVRYTYIKKLYEHLTKRGVQHLKMKMKANGYTHVGTMRGYMIFQAEVPEETQDEGLGFISPY